MLHIRIYNWLIAKGFSFVFARTFNSFGINTRVISPIAIEGSANISLGDNVIVAAHSCLAAVPLSGSKSCQLKINDGCRIGRFNHIYATKSIVLGNDVLTANNVYISDNSHNYDNPCLPVVQQPILQKDTVVIGDGSWLGQNACVIGAKIGRHCIVGANSVVTNNLPDFSVAIGAPARIIKRYDEQKNVWRATNPDGSFLGF